MRLTSKTQPFLYEEALSQPKLVFSLSTCYVHSHKQWIGPPWASTWGVKIESFLVNVVHLWNQSMFNIWGSSGEERRVHTDGQTDTHTHTHAITTKLLEYTYTHTYCNTIIYTCFQPSLWSNESHSLKGEKSNRIAQLGAKWLSGGQYFISTATASKVEREAQASERWAQT